MTVRKTKECFFSDVFLIFFFSSPYFSTFSKSLIVTTNQKNAIIQTYRESTKNTFSEDAKNNDTTTNQKKTKNTFTDYANDEAVYDVDDCQIQGVLQEKDDDDELKLVISSSSMSNDSRGPFIYIADMGSVASTVSAVSMHDNSSHIPGKNWVVVSQDEFRDILMGRVESEEDLILDSNGNVVVNPISPQSTQYPKKDPPCNASIDPEGYSSSNSSKYDVNGKTKASGSGSMTDSLSSSEHNMHEDALVNENQHRPRLFYLISSFFKKTRRSNFSSQIYKSMTDDDIEAQSYIHGRDNTADDPEEEQQQQQQSYIQEREKSKCCRHIGIADNLTFCLLGGILLIVSGVVGVILTFSVRKSSGVH